MQSMVLSRRCLQNKIRMDADFLSVCLCAGTLLVNERMLESYIIARDRFLVPNGKMFPSRGRSVCSYLHILYFSAWLSLINLIATWAEISVGEILLWSIYWLVMVTSIVMKVVCISD